MRKTIVMCCVNHKGGVGKTTSVMAISAALAQDGKKICIIDADPQANVTVAAFEDGIEGIPQDELLESILQQIIQDRDFEPVPRKWVDGVDIIPTSLDLAAVEIMMNTVTGREFLFQQLVRTLMGKYDFIFIDCPPSLGVITQNALMASDYVIIPADGKYFAMRGIGMIYKIISLLQKKLQAKVQILGYFMTNFNEQRVLDRKVHSDLKEAVGDKLFKTCIRTNTAVGESQYTNKSIFDYAPQSNAAKDYRSLTNEIINRIKN